MLRLLEFNKLGAVNLIAHRHVKADDLTFRGAVMVCSIFMASRTRSGVPFSTMAPGSAIRVTTLPGMGARNPPSMSSPSSADIERIDERERP